MSCGETMNEPDGGTGGGTAVDAGIDPREQISFTFSSSGGQYATTHGGGDFWLFEGTSGELKVSLETYTEYGAPAAPATFTLRSEDANYDTCGVCVLVRRGAETYLPVVTATSAVRFSTMGKVEGEHFAGEITNAMEFRQVSINQMTYATTDVANGKRLLVNPWTWDIVLPAPECGGHGHLHGTECHCDSGYVIDPQDEGNCIAAP